MSFSVKRKCSSYDAAYKLQVVDFAERSCNAEAERQFGVNEKQIREWRMLGV